jgi:hypothetical protein
MEGVFLVLAGVAAALHYAFLGYVVLGGFLAWRRLWAILPHVAVAAWAVVNITLGPPCPLTGVQDWARGQAGLPPLPGGFMDTHVEGVLYPERLAPVVLAGAALVVVASWSGVLSNAWRRARHPTITTGR